MSASGRDWEPVVARLYRAKHAVDIAKDHLDGALKAVCDGETDDVSLRHVVEVERRLDMAVALLAELRRSRLVADMKKEE